MIKNREEYNEYMRSYMRGYSKERRLEHRTKIMALLGNVCACGSTTNLGMSPGDDADVNFDISKKLSSAPLSKLMVQSKTYRIRCGKCRAKDFGVEHGGGASGKRNCICEPCKARKAEYMIARGIKYRAVRDAKRKSDRLLKQSEPNKSNESKGENK
jgi:hypothetical protein